MAGNFKVDTLIKTVRDLQEEKTCLEEKLKELRQKSKRIDAEDEALFSKLVQVKQNHAKMAETLKVAQYKVSQSQGQLNYVESVNSQKRRTLAEYHKQISELKETNTKERIQFEKELNDLTRLLIDAKNHFDPQNLQEQVTQEITSHRSCDIQVKMEMRQTDLMSQQMQEMMLDQDEMEYEISKSDQKQIIEDLQMEKRLLDEKFNVQKAELEDLKTQLQTLESLC